MFRTRLKSFKQIRFCSVEAGQNATPKTCIKETVTAPTVKTKKISHHIRLRNYFAKEPHLQEIKRYIPDKYFKLNNSRNIQHLYLIDTKIASRIVDYMLPRITEGQAVCDTVPGLGLITKGLLDANVPLVRMYEPCEEYRLALKDFHEFYPGRVELFVKDLFQLAKISALDKFDCSNRVGQLFRGIPQREWRDEPAMTIIGAMTASAFIMHIIRMLAMQSDFISQRRLQIFAIMRPHDYLKLSSGPEFNLHTYQASTILFDLFFEHELLDKFPREAFLPWESKQTMTPRTRYAKTVDVDQLYFVRMTLKKSLPVKTKHLLQLFYFVRQSFGFGNNVIIPTVEKWIPGCGLNFILPSSSEHYFKHMSIFTKFRELTPPQILSVFKEMVNHPGYDSSAFASMVQDSLLKSETRETSLNDASRSRPEITQELEEKLDL